MLMLGLLVSCSDDIDDLDDNFQSALADILAFEFRDLQPVVTGNINAEARTISATVPFGTPVNGLVPTIRISERATISPPSGISNNFSSPVTYLVTAENGTSREWTVTVTVAEPDAEPRLVLGEAVWNLTPSGLGVPSFIRADGERGIAYRNGQLLLTQNNDRIILLNAQDGSLEGELNMEGLGAGNPRIADVAVSADGSILACNSVEWTSDAGGQPTEFVIYRWADENAAPEVFLRYTNTQYRMGDSFTVVGDVSGNAEIYTVFGRKFLNPATRGSLIFKWSVTNGVVSAQPELIEVTQGIPTTARFGSRPHVHPLELGSGNLIVNGNDIEFTEVSRTGAFVTRIPNTNRQLWDGFTSYFEIFRFDGRTLIATAFPRSDRESRLLVVDITNGIQNVTTDNVVLSQNFMTGANPIPNVNAGGAVAVNVTDNAAEIYCLITNQGLVRFDLRIQFD